MNTQINNSVRTTLVTLAALSATLLAGMTHAAAAGDALPVKAVSYQDLNLSSNSGVRTLYKRIARAADQVCGNVDSRDLQRLKVKNDCMARAISDAVATVNSPMLTRVYLEKSGNSVKAPAIAQVR